MKKFLIWDLPARLFHWAFAASISLAFVFALVINKHHPLFQLHMLFGLVAIFLLAGRLLMGVFGSRYVRFRNFPLQLSEVVGYFAGVITARAKKYAGHNPGSALAALAMFALLPLIVLTGALGGGEAFEEAHEVLAYVLLGVIGAHLLGLVLHTLRHRENVAVSMVDGQKDVSPEVAITSGHPVWAAVLGAAAVAWSVALFLNHDANAATVRLPVLGTVVQLGENEGGKGERHQKGSEQAHGHHDDDDD
jgi:cytochrome b